MKGKKGTYLLLAALILVWGLAICRFLGALKTENVSNPHSESIAAMPGTMTRDSFSLLSNYSDPFLRTAVAVKIQASVSVKKAPEKKTVSSADKKWPEVRFDGTIKNQKSMRTLAILNVNGQSTLASPGDEISEIKLLRILKDSVEVSFGNEKKFVRK